jgi:hypothetical protein
MQAGALFSASDAARMGLIDGVATYGQVVALLAGVIQSERNQERNYSRNPTGTTMNSRPGIFRSVASAIGLGQTSIPSPETIHTDPVNDQQSTNEEMENEQQSTPNEGVTEQQYTELVERVDALNKTVQSQADLIKEQSEELSKASQDRKELNQTIANLKVGNAPDRSNANQADRSQFETATRVDESTSKY